VTSYFKVPTYRSEKWLRAVSTLACVRCYREGMTQAAHRNQSKGMSMKTDDCWTAALCVDCHRDIDSGKGLTREQRREMLDTYILLTIKQLANEGLLRVA
jgi:hypothetical protein